MIRCIIESGENGIELLGLSIKAAKKNSIPPLMLSLFCWVNTQEASIHMACDEPNPVDSPLYPLLSPSKYNYENAEMRT